MCHWGDSGWLTWQLETWDVRGRPPWFRRRLSSQWRWLLLGVTGEDEGSQPCLPVPGVTGWNVLSGPVPVTETGCGTR